MEMKLATALKMIEKREREKRLREKVIRGRLRKNNRSQADRETEQDESKNKVHVQSLFPKADVIELKKKTGEKFNSDAIVRAVYFYLKYAPEPKPAETGIVTVEIQKPGGEL